MDDELPTLIGDAVAPPDVVPRQPLGREALLGLERLAAQDRIIATVPGRVLTDPDGLPIGVAAPETVVAVPASVMVTRAELTAAGLTDADVPHLRVVSC